MSKDNNQLPPELVEKMKDRFNGCDALSFSSIHEVGIECAQIALDYSNEVNKELIECMKEADKLFNTILDALSFGLKVEPGSKMESDIKHLLEKHKNEQTK